MLAIDIRTGMYLPPTIPVGVKSVLGTTVN